MATQIQKGWSTESSTWFDLTTDRGQEVGVNLRDSSVSVYIKQNGTARRLSLGRHFHGENGLAELARAVAVYKKADVKAALSALLAEVSQPAAI